MVSVPDFGAMDSGDLFDVVARPIFFDATHEAHVLECTTSGKRFTYKGLLELGYVPHTLFRVQFVKQYPHPRVQASDLTRIFDHEVPTWHSLRSTIDACSGIGALAHGALAAGFAPAVSVDVNHRMVNLCAKTSNGECIQGDIGSDSTLFENCGSMHDILKRCQLDSTVSRSRNWAMGEVAKTQGLLACRWCSEQHTCCKFKFLCWNVSSLRPVTNS